MNIIFVVVKPESMGDDNQEECDGALEHPKADASFVNGNHCSYVVSFSDLMCTYLCN